MSIAVGLVLGIGLLLVASTWLWPSTDEAVREAPRVARVRERIVQAGLPRVSVATVVVVSVVLGTAAAAITLAFVPVLVLAAASGLIALAVPTVVISLRARASRRAQRVVWPDVVDHLVSAVRSGLALPESVVTLAHSGPQPTRDAFAAFETDYRSSGNFSDCLDRLKSRLVDPVADRIIETLRMSREVGGNELTTVLRNLAAYLRQDAAIRSEVEARQGWVLNAARLGVAAPWVVLVLLATRTEAALAYNTGIGTAVILGGLIVSVIAYRVMIGIGRLPEERRWFQ
jgi:tight adherence protein B